MSRIIAKGAADQTIYVEVLDSTSTTGGRKTGLAYNTSSLTAYYVRNGGSATSITLATLAAANSAHSDGGFKEVDSTNMPGIYRLDLPDAAVASGADSLVVTIKGATGMAQVSAEIQLVAVNPQDAVRGGMTALPNAAADAAGGLIISDAGGLDADAQRSDVTTILADTNDIQSRLPAALVSGRMDASVGAMAAGTMTASALATDAVNEIADGILDRDMSVGTDSGSTTVRTVRQALRPLRNRTTAAGTVYKEDDSTVSWTFTPTTDAAAEPIIEINPAGP